jgi:8-oxo-dGTP diphosphatase
MAVQTTDALEAYSVSLLRFEENYLLLQRSQNKEFAPGRWTGLGGHIETDEFTHLRAAGLREIQEEAGFSPADISDFSFRRALLVSRPNQPLRVVLYFTGDLRKAETPNCPEGILSWKQVPEFEALDIIETTRSVFKCLIEDMEHDPKGTGLLKVGLAVFDCDGEFQHVVWG